MSAYVFDLVRKYKDWPGEKVLRSYYTYGPAKEAKEEFNKGRFQHIVRKRELSFNKCRCY